MLTFITTLHSLLVRGALSLMSSARIQPSVKFRGWPIVHARPGSLLTIAEECTIASGRFGNAISTGNRTVIRTLGSQAQILIGRRVGISGSAIVSRQSICIGDHCLIGEGCLITDSDHHAAYPGDLRNRNKAREIRSCPVSIGSGVFVGARAIILKGTQIGDGAVIGAGSVLHAMTVPPYAVVVGNPARVVCTDWRTRDSARTEA